MDTQSQDTLSLAFVNGKLVLATGREEIPLKASSPNNFYWDDNSIEEIEFNRNKQDRVDGFVLLAGDKIKFKKLSTPRKK
jgi:hypothetical protein